MTGQTVRHRSSLKCTCFLRGYCGSGRRVKRKAKVERRQRRPSPLAQSREASDDFYSGVIAALTVVRPLNTRRALEANLPGSLGILRTNPLGLRGFDDFRCSPDLPGVPQRRRSIEEADHPDQVGKHTQPEDQRR